MFIERKALKDRLCVEMISDYHKLGIAWFQYFTHTSTLMGAFNAQGVG
jgi:hypothetical protein